MGRLNRNGLSVSVIVVCGVGADGFTEAGCAVAASLSQWGFAARFNLLR
jgi:hypothetical protein